MGSNSILYDGDYSRPNPVGSPRVVYPFQQFGDRATKGFDQDYWQFGRTFEPPLLGTQNPTDPTLFIVAATSPTQLLGDLNQFTLTWTRVPVDQISYTSQPITKPNPSQLGEPKNFLLVTGSGTASMYSVSVFEYLVYVWDVVNNRVYGTIATTTSAASAGNCRVTWTAHGLAGTERITIYAGGQWYLFASGQYSVVDANTIDLTGWSSFSTTATRAAKYYRAYTPGNDRVGVRLTQKFYLPGVTAGISTPTDIPIPDPLLNDANFLASVIAHLTGYQTYDSSDLGFWGPSIVYTQTLRDINMGDV